ncbi:hypothetical protein [Rathayibacter sp. AY2B3]|nr:hypothetical protein [Rathayibacter sp. AY2B3]
MTEKIVWKFGSVARGRRPVWGRSAPAVPPTSPSGVYYPPSHPNAPPEKK